MPRLHDGSVESGDSIGSIHDSAVESEDSIEDEGVASAPVGATASGEDSTQVDSVKQFIISAGNQGLLAETLAIRLGDITEETPKNSHEYKEATRKARRLARSVVDKTPGGSRTERVGKNVVYKIIPQS